MVESYYFYIVVDEKDCPAFEKSKELRALRADFFIVDGTLTSSQQG